MWNNRINNWDTFAQLFQQNLDVKSDDIIHIEKAWIGKMEIFGE